MVNKFLRSYILGLCIFSILVSIFYVLLSDSDFENPNNDFENIIINGKFSWPTPGFTTITSKFGYRVSPTSGASSYHGGIDIAASQGSNVIAIFSGKVTYTGFMGANGFTVVVENSSYSATYSHLSPDFLVNVGDYVSQNEIIAKIGPKNVYGVANNPYKDSSGRPTNGATTGPHLHFAIKIDGKAIDPLDFY